MADETLFEDCMQAYLADPEGYQANRDLGLIMVEINDMVLAAENHLLKALSLAPPAADHEYLLRALAKVFGYKGQFEGAIRIHRQLFDLRPNTLSYLPELGTALFAAGRIAESSDVFRVVLAAYHENAKRTAAARRGPPAQLIFPHKVLCSRFGELAGKLDIYVKARILGLTPRIEAVLPAPPELVVNRCLMDYWKRSIGGHVTILSGEREIAAVTEELAASLLFIDCYRVADGRVLDRLLVYPLIQRQWEEQGRRPLLTLSEAHRRQGRDTLGRLGMPADAWFVALHARESGAHQEQVPWDHNAFRNSAIADYLPAIEAITARGGWVVRIGDASMTPLPPMQGVVDYALSDIRSDWMDIFCCSQCRFLIGTTSGPDSVALAFGVPVVGTNWFPLGYWPNSPKDIFVHKLLRRSSDGRHLSIGESLQPPLPGLHWPDYYRKNGLEVIDSTPEDITAAVVEMIDRQDGRLTYSAEDERLQAKYRAQAEIGGIPFNPRVGAHFLRTHPFLVEGAGGPA